ncbi:MAG: ECF-type sigma factor [Bryobacterales bacterium]|nr:ECF-type sigma factor [Bryobacterales bacterium]
MSSEVVMLLRDLGSQGDLANAVIPPALYDQLRRMARSLLRNQRQGHTLQATALSE